VILARYADRPDLRERRDGLLDVWPEFLHHNAMGSRYWARLYAEHPAFQLALLDGDELVGELHSLPLAWTGELDDLPAGWDEAFERAFGSGRVPDSLCAVAIAVRPDRQGSGVGSAALDAMREAGRADGLRDLIAPVRPTLKSRYPLIPIERYLRWRRDDGSHFDPWIRLHERVGGEIVAAAPESLTIVAPVADWESWTGMRLPADGDYVVPDMLAPLVVRDGVGRHVEPNVWLRHRL
jgi:GNAT superfamily N-acetyltransferase